MYDDETFDFYLRDSERKIIKGRIDFEFYARLYDLLYRKPELEAEIAEKLCAAARIYDADVSEFVNEITQIVAQEHGIEIPMFPEGSLDQERWAMGWDKVRESEWKRQQGVAV